MKIRDKIVTYFSTVVIALVGVTFIVIYFLFAAYREEEFQQQQKEKIKYTIRLLGEYKELSENLADIMDELSIHDFYDEKMLVFNQDKKLLFSSIDDLEIEGYRSILEEISEENRWYETKQGDYDIVALYTLSGKKPYYAISKAYDNFGYTKLNFLRNLLIIIFIIITIVVVMLAVFLSHKIAQPITKLTAKLTDIDFSKERTPDIHVSSTTLEINMLTKRFNELKKRTNEAFSFQKHTVQHISHQLKTPIAVLVTELEKITKAIQDDEIKKRLNTQVVKAKSLGEVINSLLEIARIESGQQINKQAIRIDELIFDVIEELAIVYPDFEFNVNYNPISLDGDRLELTVNVNLMRQAFLNLLSNCVAYSTTPKAFVSIDASNESNLEITFNNDGNKIQKQEERFLFHHFFRGENSKKVVGFGLGLVLTKKILELNNGTISYEYDNGNNVFSVILNRES